MAACEGKLLVNRGDPKNMRLAKKIRINFYN